MKDTLDLLESALQSCSDRTPVDENLRELIIQVCSQPRGTLQRSRAMNRLLIALHRLPKLSRSSHPEYWDACSAVWKWLDQNLHNFSPMRPPLRDCLVNWINSFLRYRIKDLYKKNHRLTYMGEREYYELPECSRGFHSAIEQLEVEENKSWARAIEQYIERDSDGKLRGCHPRNRPDCNIQVIARELLLQPMSKTMTAIARRLNINVQTLNSFWRRKGRLKLEAIARELALKNSAREILDLRF